MKWHEHDKVRPLVFGRTIAVTGVGVVEQRRGYTVRSRGATDGMIEHDYECPVHGRFAVKVPRASVPDWVRCSVDCVTDDGYEQIYDCHRISPWCPPIVGIGWAAGEVTG